ncbi:E3 ubiquitin-protein ligase RSL1-like [Rhododendron vialii]|uniref:E3 ubiquitin-protein ligase RSL1-like n=1 Tax=Rhododendron vialii TaxID=182163 RepID=UPI00265DD961|nr:E3 ubiquitin-protein ligase RSL1-like [Rhododendron vialii]
MATTSSVATDLDSDLPALAALQHRELIAAHAVDSDLDFAFHLQLQEAITASLSLLPSSSSPSPPSPPQNDDVLNFSFLQAQELENFGSSHHDRLLTQAEIKAASVDLHRRIHDRKIAAEIDQMSEDEWDQYGDNFARPYGEGSSSGADATTFRVYCKGLVSEERVGLVGIGVAICDERDDLVFEIRKPVVGSGRSRQVAEIGALIEGLSAAVDLELKRVVFYCDYYPLYQFVLGRWPPKQSKIATLVSQVNLLQRKFVYSAPVLVARNDIKYAFKLARDAIVSQINRPLGSSSLKNMYETCVICLDEIDTGQIFSVDGCLHRYCFSCMKQHVEVKLLNGMLPKCPHEGCNSELKIETSRKFLTPKLIEIMSQRLEEASIPVTEKIYCPYPDCSALMSKSEVLEYSKRTLFGTERLGVRKCSKCEKLFCINCKVPWHSNTSCLDYKSRNPYPPAADAKLKTLADENLWRQCVKCNHMIELESGCYHMTCRCGYEFCYTCGSEWKNKKATCSCPLFDDAEEDYEEDDFENEDDDFEDDDDDFVYYDGMRIYI